LLTIKNEYAFSLKLYNLQGQLLISVNQPSKTHQLNIQNLSSGLYLLEVEIEGMKKIEKIIINH
jgi:hypothetical protein